ncbi:hypothetical protein [Thiohalocapsa sp. ML1]|jgi:hypothetical protein|uniref:hypothetical protein n=1 Tax=Thiohalocapsa sp. ML1 TaxID=1431688 RepID=UPI00073203DE|nr:hypothetical protein [Thiohalocapsa sp. ML1]
MSTRGWYDFYVITPDQGILSLGMCFYKWGDGTPENALEEYLLFQGLLQQHGNRLPVEWLDRLLREQLGNLHARLPPHFATTAFLFLIQRAAEEAEHERWRGLGAQYWQSDLHLRFALDEAMAAAPFAIPPHPDPLLERVRRFIATAHYLRPWPNYALRLDLLHWLQYITQPTCNPEMTSLAGDWEAPWETDFRYRLFCWIDPEDPCRIDQLAIELCQRDGTDVLNPPDPSDHPHTEWEREQLERLHATIREHNIGITSLALLEHEYTAMPDRFFRFHEQPDPEATARRARISELRPSRNMLVRLIEKRFGPEVAAATRLIMEQIDDVDLLHALAEPVLDSPDSATWLRTLRERAGHRDRQPSRPSAPPARG